MRKPLQKKEYAERKIGLQLIKRFVRRQIYLNKLMETGLTAKPAYNIIKEKKVANRHTGYITKKP